VLNAYWFATDDLRTMMPLAKNRWTVKTMMIVIALTAVIFYTGMLIVRSYIWMVRAGW
jgi:hypothetical protein